MSRLSLALFVLSLLSLGSALHAVDWPDIVLSAPFTPFNDDATRSVNTAPIAALANYSHSMGVNVIWAAGGLGQFETMSVAERKALAEEWITQAQALGMKVIVHVGTNVLADAIELAQHAEAHGADGVSSVPPFYEGVSLDALVQWLSAIAGAAPKTPFFYYHIPGSTGVNIPMAQLFARRGEIPTLAGVKYVSSDLADYLNVTYSYGTDYRFMFAPNPKIAGVPLGARDVILAEDFFAQCWIQAFAAYKAGNVRDAQKLQLFHINTSNIFGKYGGGYAERAVYRKLINVDMGPPRWPGNAISDSDYNAMVQELGEAVDFWNAVQPPSHAPSRATIVL